MYVLPKMKGIVTRPPFFLLSLFLSFVCSIFSVYMRKLSEYIKWPRGQLFIGESLEFCRPHMPLACTYGYGHTHIHTQKQKIFHFFLYGMFNNLVSLGRGGYLYNIHIFFPLEKDELVA